MLAWHFLPADRCLRWGTKEEVFPGKKITVLPPLKMCEHGLHASEDALHALDYAPGPIVCRVIMSGEILFDTDKCCAAERTCLWMGDATRILHEFACSCAEEAMLNERLAGREPPMKFVAAIKAKRDWLAGKISPNELKAVWVAAGAAALTAALAPAWEAARAASGWPATIRTIQNEKLTEMLLTLAPDGRVHPLTGEYTL